MDNEKLEIEKKVNEGINLFENDKYEHGRIIIPLVRDGSWYGFQGRSLNPNDTMRYITIILDETQPKIYGIDRTDKNKVTYITEGPFDSLFLDNAVAMVGADIEWSFADDRDVVFIYDNEPRNGEIISRMEKVIDRGHKIVIWPSSIEDKDINEMVQTGHNVKNLIESNTYAGLSAKVTLNNWKRV